MAVVNFLEVADPTQRQAEIRDVVFVAADVAQEGVVVAEDVAPHHVTRSVQGGGFAAALKVVGETDFAKCEGVFVRDDMPAETLAAVQIEVLEDEVVVRNPFGDGAVEVHIVVAEGNDFVALFAKRFRQQFEVVLADAQFVFECDPLRPCGVFGEPALAVVVVPVAEEYAKVVFEPLGNLQNEVEAVHVHKRVVRVRNDENALRAGEGLKVRAFTLLSGPCAHAASVASG